MHFASLLHKLLQQSDYFNKKKRTVVYTNYVNGFYVKHEKHFE